MDNLVLVHHGIKGQRWGVRRFQYEDGTRTPAGKARERNGEQGSAPSANKSSASSGQKQGLTDAQKDMLKKVAVGVGVAAAAGLAAYGAMQYSDAVKTEAFKQTVENGREAMKSLNKDSLYRGVMLSDELTKYQRTNLSDKYDEVNRAEWEDVMNTARKNSSSFKSAIKTVHGHGAMSTAELNRAGIRTANSNREDFENMLADLVYRKKP